MSITQETLQKHLKDPAIFCCRREKGLVIGAADLEDPGLFDDMNAKIGFHIPWTGAYIIGLCAAVAYVVAILWYGRCRVANRTLNAKQ